MSESQPVGAAYYHQKAGEIRRFAQQSKFPEIAEELFKLARRFDLMAEFVERRQIADPTGRPGQRGTVPLRRSLAG